MEELKETKIPETGIPGEEISKPDEPKKKGEKKSILKGSKGILIALVLGIAAIVIGFFAIKNMGSSDQYQGFLKKSESILNQEETTQPVVEYEEPEAVEEAEEEAEEVPEEEPEETLPIIVPGAETDEPVKISR